MAGFEDAGGRGLRAELQADAGNEFADKERFDDVVVGTQFEADDAVGFRGARGEEDDGGLGEFGVVPDAFADIEAVGIGEHDVEQNQIGANSAAKVDGATPGLRAGEGEALFLEVVLEKRVKVGVVFDQNNSFCHGYLRLAVITLQKG